jgi:uncharacterized protein YdhG (YjbR/CyaY superfamily)
MLQQVRMAVRKAVPLAWEIISYRMLACKYKRNVIIYFAGYKNHIGLHATPAGHAAFAKELSVYKQGKGFVQFPLTQSMPLHLIASIAKFKMQKQDEKAGSLPPTISAPAMRVLENNGIKTLQQLSKHTGAAILKLHGIEKTAIPVLQKALKEKDLALRLKKSV